jgi:ArsR family transcriptional regulator
VKGIAHRGFDHDADAAAALLKAVASPARLRILHLLTKQPTMTGVALVAAVGDLTQPTVSHHLGILLAAGLVSRDKDGVFSNWSLNRAALRATAHLLDPRHTR